MTEDSSFDISKFSAHLVQENISHLLNSARKLPGAAAKAIEARLRSSFENYVLTAAGHYGTARTFFIRDERKPLYNYYVPLEIALGRGKPRDASIRRIASDGLRAIISGKAGCGKSTLMRHLFLDSVRDGMRIPVFVELNQLNDQKNPNLLELTYHSFKKHGLQFDREQIDVAMASAKFSVLFDGLDEVEEGIRAAVVKQIADFSAKYPKNLLIVSSRPDESYDALGSFNLYEVQPLSLSKALALVEKLPFDEEIRGKFCRELRKSLYNEHTSFLSNPLLLSIMLLTYGQSASIPTKLCVFYNQAYEALFQTHDAYKGGFARKRLTSLDIQEFERAFSAFCLLTYDLHMVSLSRTECLDHIDKARTLSALNFNSASFLRDCLQSVNLLMEDGLKITFVHRSFQEYFAARYIARMDSKSKGKMLERIGRRSRVDNALEPIPKPFLLANSSWVK